MPRKRKTTPGSVFLPSGRKRLTIKLMGLQISTGYLDTPQGRLLAQEELERLYVGFRSEMNKIPGRTRQEKLRYYLDRAEGSATPTLRKCFDQFLAEVGPYRNPRTVEHWQDSFDCFLGQSDYLVDEQVITGLQTVYRIEREIERAITESRRSAATLANYLRSVRVFTKWLTQKGYLLSDIRYGRLRTMIGAVPRKPIDIWTGQELDAICLWCHRSGHPDVERLIRFITQTGFRIHEALELNWSDVDQARGTIAVERKDGLITQYVPATRQILDILGPTGTGKVFPWRERSDWPGRILVRACKALGIPRRGRSFHAMRKTFISALVDRIGSDLDAFTVAKLARARVEVIQNHYLQVPTERLRKAMEQMPNLIEKRHPNVTHSDTE